MSCCWLSRSALFFFLSPEQMDLSSPCRGLNASSGRAASINSGVAPEQAVADPDVVV